MDAAIIEQALDLVADGYGVRTAAEQVGVGRQALRNALARVEWRTPLARAREHQADSIVERMSEVVDRLLAGDMDAHPAKVVLDQWRWLAGKLRPQVYGDRLEVTGRDGGPIALSVVDDAELARRVALLLARAAQAVLPPARVIDGEHEEIGAPHSEGDG